MIFGEKYYKIIEKNYLIEAGEKMIYHQPHNSQGNYNYNMRKYENLSWAPHFHKNFELIFVNAGEISVTVNRKSYILKKKESVLVLSNQIHSFSIPESSEAVVIVFSEQYVPKFASSVKGLEGESQLFSLDDSIYDFVCHYMVEKESDILMKKACLYAVCDQFLGCTKLRSRSDTGDSSVNSIIEYVSANCTRDITLQTVAEEFGYEYHYLSRLLNKGYSISFSRLLGAYRTEVAIDLLESTSLSMSEIAIRSGFQSVRNFNIVFRQITGRTPKDFRI